jgi:hypothetical protein
MDLINKITESNSLFWAVIVVIWVIIYLNNNYYLNFLCPRDWDCKTRQEFITEKKENK